MVLVGERKDSQTYVKAKKKACAEAGIDSFGTDLPDDATEEEVLKVVADYNADPNVHGILVQLPMPDHIDEERVLGAIDYEKDVDGFHPLNTGRLAQRGRDVRADRLEPPGVRPEPIPPERHAGIRTVVVMPARIVLPAEKVVRAEVVR